MPKPDRASLLTSAQSFCNAFASKVPPDEIFSHFSSKNASDILIHEHGLPRLAPFLGHTYTGLSGAKQYFETISQYLTYEDMKFSDYIVDEVESKVSVRGEARFTWVSTGQGWDEVFRYVLGFDGEGKVVRYEIWADSGAAYLASRGELKEGGDRGGGES